MGTVTSDLTYNIKAQAEALLGNYQLYKLIGLQGNDGELVQLMKIAYKNNNFNEVDSLIRSIVKSFLYNEGRGTKV